MIETNKQGLQYFIRRYLHPECTIKEAAEFVHHSVPGIRKMYNRDPDKLRALFIGYTELAKIKASEAAEAKKNNQHAA